MTEFYETFIIDDASTCCSICYEMLDPGTVAFVDNDGDVICQECLEKIKECS